MKKEITKSIIPFLNARGFKGKFPTLIRESDKQMEEVMFNFTGILGMFSVVLRRYPKNNYENKGDRVLPILRLGAGIKNQLADHWFAYNLSSNDLNELGMGQNNYCTVYSGENIYEMISKDVISLLNEQAETWFAETREIWECKRCDDIT